MRLEAVSEPDQNSMLENGNLGRPVGMIPTVFSPCWSRLNTYTTIVELKTNNRGMVLFKNLIVPI